METAKKNHLPGLPLLGVALFFSSSILPFGPWSGTEYSFPMSNPRTTNFGWNLITRTGLSIPGCSSKIPILILPLTLCGRSLREDCIILD